MHLVTPLHLDSGPGLLFHTCCPQCRIHVTVGQPELGSAGAQEWVLLLLPVQTGCGIVSLRSPADTHSLLWPICGPTPYVRVTHFQVPGVVGRAELWGFPGPAMWVWIVGSRLWEGPAPFFVCVSSKCNSLTTSSPQENIGRI